MRAHAQALRRTEAPGTTTGPGSRWLAIYCTAVALVVGVVAAIGVFGRGDLTTQTFTSFRGEPVEYVVTGVYAFNPQRLVAEGVAWDLFTLFVVVPALLVLAPALARGSLRARLLTTGLFAYLAYQYLMYAMAWAVGPLLVPFVVVFAASWLGIAGLVAGIDVAALPSHVSARFPRRSMVALCTVVALLLIGMWAPMINAVNGGDLTERLYGQTTLVVQAMDLGIVVPLAGVTAVMLLRHRPVGLLLAATIVVKALAMACAITAMVVGAWMVEGTLNIAGLAIFGTAALASLALLVSMYAAFAKAQRPLSHPTLIRRRTPETPAAQRKDGEHDVWRSDL